MADSNHSSTHASPAQSNNTLRTGRPPTAKPAIFGDYVPQDLKDELFEEEWNALQELKKFPIAKHFNDRFLAAFLLARKLDLKRTKKLLKQNLKWRKENGYEKIPTFESLNKQLILSGFGTKIPGARDKSGCGILYCKMAKMIPDTVKNFDVEMCHWVIWNNAEGNLWEDMDFHRNGLTFVFDLDDIGWKNVDLGLQRRINATLMDNFPMRVTKVLVVNAPGLFKSLLAAARLFIKKKVIDRLQLVDMAQIKEHIETDLLPTEFGGNYTYPMQNYLDFVEKIRVKHPLPLAPIFQKPPILPTMPLNGSKKKKVNKGSNGEGHSKPEGTHSSLERKSVSQATLSPNDALDSSKKKKRSKKNLHEHGGLSDGEKPYKEAAAEKKPKSHSEELD